VSVSLKLLISCNLKPDVEEAKGGLAYLAQEFPAKMREAGMDLYDMWYTVYGTWPQIRMSFVCSESTELKVFLQSREWAIIKKNLLQRIQAYDQKVVFSRDNFQF
jgi:hypothetical protein